MEKLNTTTRQSSLSALQNMHYSQMIRFDNAEEASMLKSLLNIYDLDCGGWWVALGIASSIGLGLSLRMLMAANMCHYLLKFGFI
ncbi:hypothetical protein Tco_0899990 [Tanacetum coccineum]